MELNSKIGHRNYAIIDETVLTAEEIEAVESARKFAGLFGTVPYEYGYNPKEKQYETRFYRVYKTNGFTVVLDGKSRLRFIVRGYLTEDEVSLLNKGHTVAEMKALYKKLICLEIQSKNPWNLI